MRVFLFLKNFRETRFIYLEFKVTHDGALHEDHVNVDIVRLVNLAPIVLFSEYKITTSIGKQSERVHYSLAKCLRKLLKK